MLLRDLGIFCVDTVSPVTALTYDDGPDPRSTPKVLDVLERHGATATFFVLSGAAQKHPDLVRRIVTDGHEIALHGTDHRSLLTRTTADATRMVRASRMIVEDLAGARVRLYRPPYGEHTAAQGRAIHRLGLRTIIWSGHAEDWVDAPPSDVAGRAVMSVFPGSIVLLHDTRADPETLQPGERMPDFDRGDVLDRVLQSIHADGYSTATVSDMISRYPIVHSMARERMRQG
ncbi:polysaccharide deacetylase family protein [Microbacterium kribbense]|uniref:polysaccharide deacetylase family protein n=1 Tax=Microbacterium kribbense TaxID=433645 RepID=UPI0031CFC72A